MEKEYFWKRTEETEADAADILYRLFEQWRQIAVCAVAAAVILGGFGWIKSQGDDKGYALDTSQEIILTEEEERAVADAVRLEQETRDLEIYLDRSVLMQMDAYHKSRNIMLYCIDHVQIQELQAVTESYLNFVLNGGAADKLMELDSAEKTDKSCLAELITAYQKTYSSPYQVIAGEYAEGNLDAQSIFYVETAGKNSSDAEKRALELQKVIEKYSIEVQKNTGSHRLRLLNSMNSVTCDSSLQSQQRDKKALLTSNKTNLKLMTDAFNEKQSAVYKKTVYEEQEDEQEHTEEFTAGETSKSEKLKNSVKYAVFGFAGGIFAYGAVYLCWYILSDAVKSAGELKRRYCFPVYEGSTESDGKKQNQGLLKAVGQDAFSQTQVQVMNRIRLTCLNQGITKLCAVSDFSLEECERAWLERVGRGLEEQNICMETAENVNADTEVWKRLIKTGNVLMVYRTGTTTHREIDDAMTFYTENSIAVAGAVVFLQKKTGLVCESLNLHRWRG